MPRDRRRVYRPVLHSPKARRMKGQLVVPNDTIATYVNGYRSEDFGLIFERTATSFCFFDAISKKFAFFNNVKADTAVKRSWYRLFFVSRY